MYRFENAAIGIDLGPPTHSIVLGVLEPGGEKLIDVEFEAGRRYTLVGVCDDDCVDLGIALIDPAGKEIKRDDGPERDSWFGHTADVAGTFRVRVFLVKCTAENCGYGVTVRS
jgi:hypothetical protein